MENKFDIIDNAKGCLFGALLGDALGAYLEFRSYISKEDVEKAFTLPGGGALSIGEGEITDDGELTLSLGKGLIEGNGKMDINKIAKCYHDWYQSDPFDIGNTTRASVSCSSEEEKKAAIIMREAAFTCSIQSQANGSLMRASSLAIWCYKLKESDIYEAAKQDSLLTHPNETVYQCTAFYLITISYLLNGYCRKDAYEKAKNWAKNGNVNSELLSWINDIDKQILPNAKIRIGHIKNAFIYAFNYFLLDFTYVEAIKSILLAGGDTDTNACIAGGLIGASEGFKNLPKEIVDKMLNWTYEKGGGYKRPEYLTPLYAFKNNLVENLLNNSPTILKMIGNK